MNTISTVSDLLDGILIGLRNIAIVSTPTLVPATWLGGFEFKANMINSPIDSHAANVLQVTRV
jgi:hypothetical protein